MHGAVFFSMSRVPRVTRKISLLDSIVKLTPTYMYISEDVRPGLRLDLCILQKTVPCRRFLKFEQVPRNKHGPTADDITAYGP